MQLFVISSVLINIHCEATIRYNKHNLDGKSYILDPSWIINNDLNGNDILTTSLLKKHADSKYSNEFDIYHDEDHSGIIRKFFTDGRWYHFIIKNHIMINIILPISGSGMAQELLDMAATGWGSASSIIPDDILVWYKFILYYASSFYNNIL